jgi:hypothetical protein
LAGYETEYQPWQDPNRPPISSQQDVSALFGDSTDWATLNYGMPVSDELRYQPHGLYPRVMGRMADAAGMYGAGLDAEMLAAQGMYGQFDPKTGQWSPGQLYGAFQGYAGDLMGRYGQRTGRLMGMQGRQGGQLMGMQGRGMADLMGGYGQARGEIGGAIAGQNLGLDARYGMRLSNVMGMLDELGGQERRDIESAWDDQSSQAQMDLASRGLSNTTVLSTMEAGYEERKRDDLGRLDERLRREKTGAYESLSADMLMSQERGYLRALETELGLRTGELGAMERGYGQQLGLATGLSDQRLGMAQGLTGQQLAMYGQLGQQGLGYMESGAGTMMGAMEADRLARYGLMQDTMGYDIGLTQSMMNFEAGIQHMPPSMYPWQVVQQGIGAVGDYWGSMKQAQAYQDAQQQSGSWLGGAGAASTAVGFGLGFVPGMQIPAIALMGAGAGMTGYGATR